MHNKLKKRFYRPYLATDLHNYMDMLTRAARFQKLLRR